MIRNMEFIKLPFMTRRGDAVGSPAFRCNISDITRLPQGRPAGIAPTLNGTSTFSTSLKQNKIPSDILSRIPLLESLLASDDRIIFAYIFGGLAAGNQRPLSDIDIAVYLDSCADKAEVKLDIIGSLSDTLKTDEIDLVILNDAPISLVGRILRMKRLIVDKQPFLRHKFESLALREFFDFRRIEEDILKRRFA